MNADARMTDRLAGKQSKLTSEPKKFNHGDIGSALIQAGREWRAAVKRDREIKRFQQRGSWQDFDGGTA